MACSDNHNGGSLQLSENGINDKRLYFNFACRNDAFAPVAKLNSQSAAFKLGYFLDFVCGLHRNFAAVDIHVNLHFAVPSFDETTLAKHLANVKSYSAHFSNSFYNAMAAISGSE